MLRTHKILSLSFSSLLLTGMAVVASADTTATQTQSASLQPTNINTNFTFTKFDTTLGTLQSITIDLSGTVAADGTVNSISSAGDYTFNASAQEKLKRPGGATTILTINPFNPLVQHLGSPGDPAVPYTFPTNTGSDDSGAFTLSSLSDRNAFSTVGAGTIALPFTANGLSGIQGPGAFSQTTSTQASAIATLYYTYTPASPTVPEPGTWAMLVAGASTGLVAVRRRRRKK